MFKLITQGVKTSGNSAGATSVRWVALTSDKPVDLDSDAPGELGPDSRLTSLESLFNFIQASIGVDFYSAYYSGPGHYFQDYASIRQTGRRLLVKQLCGIDC